VRRHHHGRLRLLRPAVARPRHLLRQAPHQPQGHGAPCAPGRSRQHRRRRGAARRRRRSARPAPRHLRGDPRRAQRARDGMSKKKKSKKAEAPAPSPAARKLRLIKAAISLACGALLFLSCADFDIWPLTWVSIAPVLWVALDERTKKPAVYGF